MRDRTYWLNLFSMNTWQEFLNAGGEITGFRENRWSVVKKIKIGDYLLCYMTGISRLIGVLEVTSDPYKDTSIIWSNEIFPCRVKVKNVVSLTPNTAIKIINFREELSIFRNLENPHAWTGFVRGSPSKWNTEDGKIILKRLKEAKQISVAQPIIQHNIEQQLPILETDIGLVTVPEMDDNEALPENNEPPIELRKHTEIQYLLLKLGQELEFNIWVARNDRSREINGRKFSDTFQLLDKLPLQFDEATTKTIGHIDVLWLKRNSIIAAFEIESTTSIYSGLLRMSDLIAMQPNLNIPLYLVAPDDRRHKVFEEVNRPTFARLSPALAEIVRFISFSKLQTEFEKILPFINVIRPEFIERISESCLIEEI